MASVIFHGLMVVWCCKLGSLQRGDCECASTQCFVFAKESKVVDDVNR